MSSLTKDIVFPNPNGGIVHVQKLEPLSSDLPGLAKAREYRRYNSWGEVGVNEPTEHPFGTNPRSARGRNGDCWADVRVPGSSDYAASFTGCKNTARQGYLTCRVHYEQELAALELKCEIFEVEMTEIAWLSKEEKDSDWLRRKREWLEKKGG